MVPGLVLLLIAAASAGAQPRRQPVEVVVAPDHADWTYRTGEQARFRISVLRYGNLLPDSEIRFEIGPEKMKPEKTGVRLLESGELVLEGVSMPEPGFLRCRVFTTVDGEEYTGYATAAFQPLDIQPTTGLPDDFSSFWERAKAKAARVPLDAHRTLLPGRGTATVDVYHVRIQNFAEGTRLYGILSRPRRPGRYPALLRVPGAGARPYAGETALAEKGVITLEIGIHGVPVDMERSVYSDMMAACLRGYWYYNLDDRDHYYYKRVYLGCVRAVDYLFSLPEFDGENLAVTGGSQGGALSIVTAGLDSRVKWLAPFYPALCDLTGYLHDRAGGWPHMFSPANASFNDKKDKIATSRYYDVANFARFVRQPGFYSWGFNDTVCPPTSMYAAYNVIRAPKQLFPVPDTGHWAYPEQRKRANDWLLKKLLGDPSSSNGGGGR